MNVSEVRLLLVAGLAGLLAFSAVMGVAKIMRGKAETLPYSLSAESVAEGWEIEGIRVRNTKTGAAFVWLIPPSKPDKWTIHMTP